MDGNPPVRGGSSRGFGAWSGRIPRASEQLGPCATTAEPAFKSPCSLESGLCPQRRHRNEKPVHRFEGLALLAATRESLCEAAKTQHSQK